MTSDNSSDTGATAAEADEVFDRAWQRLVATVHRANHDLRAAATEVLDAVAHLGAAMPPTPDDVADGPPELLRWSGKGWRVELDADGRITADVPDGGFPAGEEQGERLRDFALALLAVERRRRRRGQDAQAHTAGRTA